MSNRTHVPKKTRERKLKRKKELDPQRFRTQMRKEKIHVLKSVPYMVVEVETYVVERRKEPLSLIKLQ